MNRPTHLFRTTPCPTGQGRTDDGDNHGRHRVNGVAHRIDGRIIRRIP